MATLYVTEFSDVGIDARGQPFMSPDYATRTAKWSMAITGSSVPSQAFASNTRFLKIHTDTSCFIDIAASPVASTSYDRIPAGDTQFVGVLGGWKIAVTT